MHLTRMSEAPAYDAPRHYGMHGYRVQGGEISPFGSQVGVSVFAPGGGAEASASPVDRVYVVAVGEIVLTSGGIDHTLREFDSCFIPAGEERALANRATLPAILITVIPKASPPR